MADALIFDDDPYVSNLMLEVLQGLGLKVLCYPDGRDALLTIRKERPRLVLVDLMMPGLDGVSICLMVKNDPKISRTKVAVVSGKGFPEDKEKALRVAGADIFVEKPFVVTQFAQQMSDLLKAAPPAPESSSSGSWALTVWGQGEPGCISMRQGQDLFVFDAGRAFERLVKERARWEGVKQVWLCLTHYHADHIAGLSHAAEWVRAGLPLRVCGPRDSVLPLADRVAEELDQASPDELRRFVSCSELSEGGFVEDSPIRIEAMSTMHPGQTLAYRLEGGGRRVVFCPDNELKRGWEEAMVGSFEKLANFSKGADLLIHDSRYTDADYPSFALQGHSSPLAALRLGLSAAAQRLMLFHIDARYNAASRRDIESGVKSAAAKEGGLEIFLAFDGMEVKL